MIFSPNKFELYCCLLRNTIQSLIIKNGYKEKYLKNLVIIHKFEALISQETEPINIKSFSLEILRAVYLKLIEKNSKFSFKITDTGVFLINKKLYTSLLLSLCQNSEQIEVGLYKEKILISAFNTKFKDISKFLFHLNAKYFFERKNKSLYILITAPKTDKKPENNEKDWEYILNPLSVVNIYLT